MKKQKFPTVTFLLSVADLKQLPKDEGNEVAFVGRSNAGKSSALNAITQQKKIAKISKTPGRTQLINFFTLDEHRRLVDLPGYGYAKVTLAIKERWQKTLAAYLATRNSLHGLVLIMDCRHPLKDSDELLLTWGIHHGRPIHVLLTKADKLSRSAALLTLKKIDEKLKAFNENISCQLFSAHSALGVEEARSRVLGWLDN